MGRLAKYKSATARREQMKNTSLIQRIWKGRRGYLFILPLIVFAVGLCYYPAISAIITSLFEWDGTGTREFIGIDNYIRLSKTFA